eukprot:SAG31_NODE_38260_length_297_cov_1.454545_1_plen_60_part_10
MRRGIFTAASAASLIAGTVGQQQDCEIQNILRFPGYSVAATNVQHNYAAENLADGNPETG